MGKAVTSEPTFPPTVPLGTVYEEIGTDALPVGSIAGCVALGSTLFAYSPSYSVSSPDGIVWTPTGSEVPCGAAGFGLTIVFDGAIWMFGGPDSNAYIYTTVWKSLDGITWAEVGALPDLGIWMLQPQVFENKLWIITGGDSRKVFSSPDGAAWTEDGVDALPFAINEFASASYAGKLWMFGGYLDGAPSKKVWNSADGITWVEVGTDALPDGWVSAAACVYDNKMFLLTGAFGSAPDAYTRKVYSSTDGITWTEAGTDALPVGLIYSCPVVFDGRLFVVGGGDLGGDSQKVFASIGRTAPLSILVTPPTS